MNTTDTTITVSISYIGMEHPALASNIADDILYQSLIQVWNCVLLQANMYNLGGDLVSISYIGMEPLTKIALKKAFEKYQSLIQVWNYKTKEKHHEQHRSINLLYRYGTFRKKPKQRIKQRLYQSLIQVWNDAKSLINPLLRQNVSISYIGMEHLATVNAALHLL